MYVTTNSALVWKRMADQNQQSARHLARVIAGLLVLLMVMGAYAYSTRARYDDLCRTIELSAATSVVSSSPAPGMNIASNYCI